MKTIARLLGWLVAILAILVCVAFFLPREVSVERDTRVEAGADEIFAYINSLKRTQEWSPWLERDPDVAVAFEGPDSGVGSRMTWLSDQRDVGSGSQEIIASVPGERVETALDFGDMGTATAQIALASDGDATLVTWGFTTDIGMNPISRWMGLMMDGMVGDDYEDGLARLKTLVESGK